MLSPWSAPPPDLELFPRQLHIFCLDLGPSDSLAGLDDLLDQEEITRARRYRFDADRRRFARAHGQTRQILGALLGVAPTALIFEKNLYGKPALLNSRARFNLSHSQDVGLLAVAMEQEVGVDIEAIRADIDHEMIAGRFFSPEEQHALQALPDDSRVAGFFHCWTRKEAYIKARGLGLSIPLDQFAVSLQPGQPARLLHPEAGAPSDWTLFGLAPQEGFCGAAAIQGAAPELFCWAYREAKDLF